jgi:two-component system sensor kinase FixL
MNHLIAKPARILLATAILFDLGFAVYGYQVLRLAPGILIVRAAAHLALFVLFYRLCTRAAEPATVVVPRAEEMAPEPVPVSIRDDAPFRRLVDEFPDAILVLEDGRPFYVNRALLALFELAPADVDEANFAFARLLSFVRHAGHKEDAATAGRAPFRTVTATGRPLVLEAGVFPLGPAGSPMTVAVLLDATARASDDSQRREMEAEILRHARLGAVGRVAMGIAHGITDALTAVLGTAEIGQIRRPEATEFGEILESAREMVRVIEDLVSKGRDDYRRGRSIIDLGRLVRTELDLLTSYLPSAAMVETEVDFQEGLPTIEGVTSDFSLSIGSLLANAIEAMEESPRRYLRVALRAHEEELVLSISHTGRGMARRELADALRPTLRTAADADAPLGGDGSDDAPDAPPEPPAGSPMGMGLPTCRYLLSRYGARMDVVTSPEGGTTLRIRVPLPEEKRPAPRPEPVIGAEHDLASVYVY